MPSSATAAVLVLRAWVELSGGLRVRLVFTSDVLEGEAQTETSASIEDVCDRVRRWLQDYEQAVMGHHESSNEPPRNG